MASKKTEVFEPKDLLDSTISVYFSSKSDEDVGLVEFLCDVGKIEQEDDPYLNRSAFLKMLIRKGLRSHCDNPDLTGLEISENNQTPTELPDYSYIDWEKAREDMRKLGEQLKKPIASDAQIDEELLAWARANPNPLAEDIEEE